MGICQIMIMAFMYGWETEGYSKRDLEIGLQYVDDVINEGYTKEPFHRYDLKKFKRWCKKQLRSK